MLLLAGRRGEREEESAGWGVRGWVGRVTSDSDAGQNMYYSKGTSRGVTVSKQTHWMDQHTGQTQDATVLSPNDASAPNPPLSQVMSVSFSHRS